MYPTASGGRLAVPHAGVVDALLIPWTQALGTSPAVLAAGREVLARYAEPHRRYHDLRHLGEVLDALRTLAPGGDLPVAVVAAAYWHDAVYEGAPDDEQRSAELAERTLPVLGRPPAEVAEVVRLVRLTLTHDPVPDDVSGGLLCDADLAVLATPAPRYLEYARAVRQEHIRVADDAFARGRSTVLHALLARPHLYATPLARSRWEDRARENVQAELSRLGGAPDGADRLPGDG